jgi:hypothetical protein
LDDADEEPADLGQPLQGAIAEPSDAARAIEPEPACQGQQSAGVPQLDDRQPLPVSSDAEAVPALPGEARLASEEGTDVVRVGEGEDHGGEDARRRGWWQRLLS